MKTHILAVGLAFESLVFADNMLHPATPVLDRPNLITLGVQLPITGDDNYNASVTVRYRRQGTTVWLPAMPLFRVRPEVVRGWTVTPQFAGTVFDLRPATTYEIELCAVDPDGPVNQTFVLTGTTRTVPGDPPVPKIRPVSSPAGLQSAMSSAQPGDVILLANGVYNSSYYGIWPSGTAQNPIVIRGASQDGVILDGMGCNPCNVIEVYGSFVHIEQLTIRNAERAIRFQATGAQGNVVRRVRISNTRMGIGGRSPQYNFYIADNILEGRLVWPQVYWNDNGLHSSDDGILVSGFGHVVAHNRISGYGDAMKISHKGARAVDFYGNDVLYTYDNGTELDDSEGNVRCFRNRYTNAYSPVSVQPLNGGPAYVLRNEMVNVVDEQFKFHGLGISPNPEPVGVLVYHNTVVRPFHDLIVQASLASHHFALENNLFLGPTSPTGGMTVLWSAPIDDGVFDYNGYYPDGRFLFNLPAKGGFQNYPSLAALQAAGMEQHGLILNGMVFASGLVAPVTYLNLLPPQDTSLAVNSPALDRGRLLPNVNDTFKGAGPDLGALEAGCPVPHYGPRPAGTDENNQPLGCPPSTTVAVTIDTAPAGRSFTVDGTTYNAAQTFQWVPGSTHVLATSTPQQASIRTTRFLFQNWSDAGAISHTVTAPTTATTYTATFKTQYLLTAYSRQAGTAWIPGGKVTPSSGYLDANTTVSVAAWPNPGYTFTGFSGDLTNTASPQNLVMNAPKTVIGYFAKQP